jgi:RND family efflux transporter MFP subunit
MENPVETTTAPRASRKLFVGVIVLVVLAVLGALLMSAVRHRREARETQALRLQAERGTKVLVTRVQMTPGIREVGLPGDVRAFLVVQVSAKVNGYVKDLLVDKGDRVKRGQVLGHIESPETDRQVDAARATLVASRSNAVRARELAPAGVLSRQDLDNANAAYGVAQAEVRRTSALQEYQVLRAPFDGVVTQRYLDPGALVSGTANQPVIEVSDPKRLRVFIYAGQDVAPFVKIGDVSALRFPQFPGLEVPATVTRISGSLDPRSRSMLVELQLDNDRGLLPGIYALVDVRVAVPPMPSVPTEALIARGDRILVPTVVDNKLHFVQIEPGYNDGKHVEIRSGLRGGEMVALAIPSELAEGAPVIPTEQKQQPPKANEGQQPQQQQQQPAGRRPEPPPRK